MFFFALTQGVGPAAQALLTQGVGFSGLTLAVTSPEGDDAGELIQQLTASMRDIRQYCTFRSMTWEEAAQGLEEGEVTAILVLPEDFVGGVLDGTNPDVTLVVPGDRPLEGLLTYWVGQSAADLLSAAQQGIYAVLELYPGQEISGLSWDQFLLEINLRYINQTLNRQSFFREQVLQTTGAMPMGVHYALSLLIFLTMSLPPLMLPLFRGESRAFRRRLCALGWGAGVQYLSSVTVCFWVLLGLTVIPAGTLNQWSIPPLMLLALLGAAFCGACCLISRTASGCGGIAVLLAGGGLFLSGGVIPPALLPEAIRWLSRLLPGEPMRSLLYLPVEDWTGHDLAMVLLWTAGLLLLGFLLFRRDLREREVGE